MGGGRLQSDNLVCVDLQLKGQAAEWLIDAMGAVGFVTST
jgi:hypothetical protein